MVWGNVSVEGHIRNTLKENIDARKYTFLLCNSLVFLGAPEYTDADFLTLKGQVYYVLYIPDTYYGKQPKRCNREFIQHVAPGLPEMHFL